MYLTQLRLVNFRNHARTELMLTPGMQFFIGPNAQGKSNLLEAVGLAATGRSHRAGRDVDLIRWGESWARVRVAYTRRDRTAEIDVGLRTDSPGVEVGRAGKEIRLNGVAVRRGELFGHLLVVVVSADDVEVVTGPPVHRRRVLDLVLAQQSPAYFFTVQRYAEVLLQRNRLLREAKARELEGWDEQLALLGAGITVRRRELIARLARPASTIYQTLSGGSKELTVRYLPTIPGDGEEEMFDAALAMMQRKRSEEVSRGLTLVGPHRDELELCVNGRELRLYGSRGQHQAALLALRLTERQVLREETGEEPVLLFDDALSALDERRQASLFEHLYGIQTLITLTTMATVQAGLREASVYRVVGGVVESARAYRA